ncbi:MAG: tRNA (adenosine(37)-N6)-threonylcarbamoyltransferase complex dimerization subunit type 1 TsaB [Chitinophagaceae bacterium]|nr:tRNA (adenosine(37)-N6)-threonylcarbamoyltransferase complex dimerization subunit type 1 TsaB [Chitinophagaceae bacterium]
MITIERMSLILNIDTSSENASICVARDGAGIVLLENADQKDHAAWIHPAIAKSMKQANCTLNDLKAIAVTAGPGSYTGLRVGMSTAKGLCYALNIPLVTENTLRVMALATKQTFNDLYQQKDTLFCPMLDARRMEVFTALFNTDLEEVMPSSAIVLDEDSFLDHLAKCKIIFSGNGSKKMQQLVKDPRAIFAQIHHSAEQLSFLSNKKFVIQQFDDIAYAEPLYLKEFYTVSKK